MSTPAHIPADEPRASPYVGGVLSILNRLNLSPATIRCERLNRLNLSSAERRAHAAIASIRLPA